MVTVRTEKELISQIKVFATEICVPWNNGAAFFKRAMENNPKILFFIRQCNAYERIEDFISGFVTVIKIDYYRDGLSYDDVFAVSDDSDAISRLCECVGNFKSEIGLIPRRKIEMDKVLKLFNGRYSTVFPHVVTLSAQSYIGENIFKYKISVIYRITKDKMIVMDKAVARESNRIASLLFEPSMPDAVKIYLAHNYLSTSIKYYGADSVFDLEKSFVHSAYGAFVTKKCVCQGIANAFKILMDKADVDCEVVCGQIIGSEDYHAWNIVRTEDDSCFHVDVTWDLSEGSPVFTYFGKSDSFFKESRTWSKDIYPKCHSRQSLYMLARPYIVDNADRLARKIPPEVIGL